MKSTFILLASALVAFAEPPVPKFLAQDIDKTVTIGYGVAVADVDGDKLADILLADARQIRWYKNPGKRGAEWPCYIIAEELTKNDNVCIAAQDIDGDGKCEVAVGAEWNPNDTEKSGAVFYLIAPTDRTLKWEPVKFPSVEPTTHRMRWVKLKAGLPPHAPNVAENPRDEWGLVVAPLHGRGNKNGAGDGAKLFLYRPPSPINNPKGDWKAEMIDDSMHLTHNFHCGHAESSKLLNADVWTSGDANIVLVGKEGIASVQQIGPPLAGSQAYTWRSTFFVGSQDVAGSSAPVVPEFKGAGEIRMWRLSDNPQNLGAATVEPMHGNQLVVYAPSGRKLLRRVLTDKLIQGHALACGNLLDQGGDQIVVGWRGNKPGDKVGIAVWTALDDQGEKWRETLVDDNQTACEDLALADLDGDGKIDIIAAGRATHNLRILWNER